MNVVILETGAVSQTISEIIETYYNLYLQSKLAEPINVIGYISERSDMPLFLGDKSVLHFIQFIPLYQKQLINKIIFPREVYVGQNNTLKTLLKYGVRAEDIFITERLTDSVNLSNFMSDYFSSPYMPYLEFRIADHCNMNCKSCAEFSGLVKKPHFPDLKKFTQDFERLHEFINDIGFIRILGGEPLLNPEINDYVKLTRRLYPFADVHVVTNALLLMKMPDEFFNTVRECNARISISVYLPIVNKIDAITNFLEHKKVKYLFNQPLVKQFRVNTSLTPNDSAEKMFYYCHSTNCRNLWDGKLAVCYKASAIKIFNDYFNTHLPENSGLIDLYDETLTTEKLKRQLFEPFELCRYCTPDVLRDWGIISHPASINDWLSN